MIHNLLQHKAAGVCCHVSASLPLMMSFKQAFCHGLWNFCRVMTGNVIVIIINISINIMYE